MSATLLAAIDLIDVDAFSKTFGWCQGTFESWYNGGCRDWSAWARRFW